MWFQLLLLLRGWSQKLPFLLLLLSSSAPLPATIPACKALVPVGDGFSRLMETFGGQRRQLQVLEAVQDGSSVADETPQQQMDRIRAELTRIVAQEQQQRRQQQQGTLAESVQAADASAEAPATSTGVEQAAEAASSEAPLGTAAGGALPVCELGMFGGRPGPRGRHKEKYGGWVLCRNGIVPGAIVYSFGIGSDVSFDYDLTQKGCDVYGWDPTKTIKYVRLTFRKMFNIRGLPRNFHYSQIGLGVKDESLSFNRHVGSRSKVGSMSAVALQRLPQHRATGFTAPVQSLETCRRQWKHSRRWLDVVKIDVEGLEFDICESAGFHRVLRRVVQLAIEFHERLVTGGRRRKAKCIAKLQQLGFSVVHQTKNAREMSFARLQAMSA